MKDYKLKRRNLRASHRFFILQDFPFSRIFFLEGDGKWTNGEGEDVVMEKNLDVIMEKNSLEEKTSLSTQVGAPGPAGWASPPPTGGGTCSGPANGMDTTITTETSQVMGVFACLTGCRRTSDGTNVACLLTSRHALLLCCGSRYHRGVDQDTRSHGARQWCSGKP